MIKPVYKNKDVDIMWLKRAKMSDEDFEFLESVKDACLRKYHRLPKRNEKLLVYSGEDIFEGRKFRYKISLVFSGWGYELDREYHYLD